MNIFMLNLHVGSLPLRLVAIGFVRDCLDNDRMFFQHRHNLFELHYVFEGQCITRIGEGLRLQQQKKVYLIAPGVYHSQKSCSSPFEKICVSFEILTPPGAGNRPADVFRALSTVQYFSCDAEQMADTLSYLRSAFLDYENRVFGTDELRIITELLILQLLQRISSNLEQSAPQTNMVDIQRVYLIDEFFNNNFHRNNGDTLLAQKLCVSIRQLNRILRNLYGRNFREKLLEIRLEVAMDLLAASNKSIAEISEITGYSCPANFSTFIKNATGKTPSELRQLRRSRPDDYTASP